MKLYKLSNVSKEYKNLGGSTKALDNVSLKIKTGQVVVILGPSGSGKSTLLNILSGIDRPTSGVLYFNKSRFDKYGDEELTMHRRVNVGFVFQNYNLVPNLTLRENIELGSNLIKDNADIDNIINMVGLSRHENKYPYQLSGGQMQRVSIARALSMNPKVLFCDEPTGALDEENGKNILKLLQNINKKRRMTIIIVTHNPNIANIADVVFYMNSGKIVEVRKNKETINALELRWV